MRVYKLEIRNTRRLDGKACVKIGAGGNWMLNERQYD